MSATAIDRAVAMTLEGEVERTPEGFAGRFRLPDDFLGFSGHFPGFPVCPAVVQLAAAESVIERGLGRPLRLVGADSAKFLSPLGPGLPVEVRCAERAGAEGIVYDVRMTADSGPVSSFVLRLAADD